MFYLSELHLKNTIAPNSTHVKKTLTLGKVGVEDEMGSAGVEGVSFALDYESGNIVVSESSIGSELT